MTSATVPATPSKPAHPAAPPRADALATVLRSAKRQGVPIRKTFVQQGRGRTDTKPGPLAGLVSRGDERGLDAYLLLHAAASAHPWDCTWPSDTWVHLLDLTSSTSGESTKAAVSKVFARLAKTHHLVDVGRVGRRSSVVLLKEDGSKDKYTRPVTKDDAWFTLPHSYFLKGYDQSLTLPAKAMLLVALHLKDDAWLPSEYAKEWFGISPTTARAGLAELVDKGLLTENRKYNPDMKSPTLWAEKVSYRRAGPMRVRKAKVPPAKAAPKKATPAKAAPLKRTASKTTATPTRRVVKKSTRKKPQE